MVSYLVTFFESVRKEGCDAINDFLNVPKFDGNARARAWYVRQGETEEKEIDARFESVAERTASVL